MMIEGMYKLTKTLEEMNSNLERIAKTLERAYPPVIITAPKEITKEETRSVLERLESTRGVYNPVTCKWEEMS